MFFITPQRDYAVSFDGAEAQLEPSKKRKQQHSSNLQSNDDTASGYYPKRIPKACDRCRVKKVKCSGGNLCKRCDLDGVVCITTSSLAKEEAPVDPRQHHLVENQRDRLLQILSEIVHGKDESEVAKLREVIGNMGLSVKSLPISTPVSSEALQSAMTDTTALEEVPQQVWWELYSHFANQAPDGLWPNTDELYPTTLAGNRATEDVSFDSSAPPLTDSFDFDDMVEWNSFQPPLPPTDQPSWGHLSPTNGADFSAPIDSHPLS